MSAFPDTVGPSVPYATSDAFATIVAGPYRNKRKVRQKGRTSPLFRARPRFPRIYWSNYVPHYQFFMDRAGAFESFTWFDFNGHTNPVPGMQWPKIPFFTRDGSTVNVDLPFKSGATGYVLDSNGVAMVGGGVDYTVTAGAGTDGRDLLTLAAAGTAGHLVRASALGRRAVNVTFTNDEMSFDNFFALITSFGLEIEEVVD